MLYIDEDNVQFRNGIAYHCGELCNGDVAFWHKKQPGASELKCKMMVEYENGLKHGRQEEFTIHGQTVCVSNYKEGKLHGMHLEYRPDGRVAVTVEYVEGKVQADTQTFYDSMGKAI